MPSRVLPYPLFDADNHLYETQDAFTKFLPKQYASAIQYVQIEGRTKIVVRGQISDYIPNPTFEVVARPGRDGGVLRASATPRASRAGRSSASRYGPPGVPRAGVRGSS